MDTVVLKRIRSQPNARATPKMINHAGVRAYWMCVRAKIIAVGQNPSTGCKAPRKAISSPTAAEAANRNANPIDVTLLDSASDAWVCC